MKQIYVALIHHRHGINLYAATTEAGMRRQVADYCREWWGECEGFEPDAPTSDLEAIGQYFDWQNENGAEFWEGECVDLIGETIGVEG